MDFFHILAGPLTAILIAPPDKCRPIGLEIFLCGTSPKTATSKVHCQGPAPYLSDVTRCQGTGNASVLVHEVGQRQLRLQNR